MTRLFISLFLVCLSLNVNANANINVTDLKNNGVSKWEHKVFKGKTSYNIVNHKGKQALKATTDSEASGLFLKRRIDLFKTPFINWSWLAEKKLPQLNERSQAGEDFVARVYVIIDGGMLVWKSRSISYVWSSNQSRGQVWNSPFLGSKVKILAARGKEDKLGQWQNEKRNVYQDLIKHFGNKGSNQANQNAYRFIDVVAVLTDADNSKSKLESYYGDIIFSAR